MSDDIREKIKKLLEIELGLPLSLTDEEQYVPNFNDDRIILNHHNIDNVYKVTINGKLIDDYTLMKKQGIIYLNSVMSGKLYINYAHSIPEKEYLPLLNMMVDYEQNTDKLKDATSISEGKVSISFDKSTTEGAKIQSMIDTLKKRHSCAIKVI